MKKLIEKLGLNLPKKMKRIHQQLGYTPNELAQKMQNNELSREESKRIFDVLIAEFCIIKGKDGEQIFDEETFQQMMAVGKQISEAQQLNEDRPRRRLTAIEAILKEGGYDQEHTKN